MTRRSRAAFLTRTSTGLAALATRVCRPRRNAPSSFSTERRQVKPFRMLPITIAALAFLLTVGSGTAAAGAAFKVSSTLDGKTTLPSRLHWLVYPKLSPTKVAEVDFLIDGKVRWIEHSAPYNYASDENGKEMGFLITTWLSAGTHTFTSRVLDMSGNSVRDTVRARVLAAPAPPAPLQGGIWTRIVQGGGSDGPPTGRWELVFDRVGAWHLDPLGSGVANQVSFHGNVINVFAPIQMAPLINDHTTVKRYGHHNIGGFDCTMAGPFGSYHWSVSGDQLTLTAIKEGCAGRGTIWQGTWTRKR